MKKQILFFSVSFISLIFSSDPSSISQAYRQIQATHQREQLRELVDGIMSQGTHLTVLEGTPQERLQGVLRNFHRELVFLKAGLQDMTSALSNQFCPIHGNLEKHPTSVKHNCLALKPRIAISLKKITNRREVETWIANSPDLKTRQKRIIIGDILLTLGFNEEIKLLIKEIFEFTWHCSVTS